MNKKVLIIGASSGIGLASAKLLASKGHEVFTASRTQSEELSSLNLPFQEFDVLQNELDTSFLPEELDSIIYCPGSINLKPFRSLKEEVLLEDFKLNAVGALKTVKAVYPKLRKSESGSIVFFSTVAVQTGMSFHSSVAMAKGAVEGLTKTLAAELAPKIRVNAIAPSLTETPLAGNLLSSDEKREASVNRHPLKRIGQSDEIASLVSFLISDESAFVTGQIFGVDGGMSSVRSL